MDGELPPGVYEDLVTSALEQRLAQVLDRSTRSALAPAEAPDRLALHISDMVRRAVEALPSDQRVALGAQVAREIGLSLAAASPRSGVERDAPIGTAEVLRLIRLVRPDGSLADIATPLTPLLDTTLLTNSPGEPRLVSQIQSEIESADGIDLIMAFIRRSGLNPIREALQRHCQSGKRLRVLTTTYTSTTQLEALQDLVRLGAQVRVSYDTSSTRLHAKAWILHRRSGASTSFVGSSNLTHQAQHTGLEWNLRVSGRRNPDVLEKVAGVFDAYWESGDFVDFDAEEFARRSAVKSAATYLSPVEIRLEPFQERLLEQVEVARRTGFTRNLLVAATGTGKTVMAAVDYGRLKDRLQRSRLLFVAHRQELLEQALATFRHHLRDASFGELWAAGKRPIEFQHVFASIQSLHSVESMPADHFDVVIVDEFHHAAAATYRRLLDHVEPVQLLGLTATPERSDGQDILHWFGDRIAAELRLWDAIDQRRLSPFTYFGVSDGIDLTGVSWTRGRGYDVAALSNVYTGDRAWARRVLGALHERSDGPVKALGFCVDVDHAHFMADVFNGAGTPAVAVSGRSPDAIRSGALADLRSGRVQVIFSVDLFNEGLDVPDVDTLLLLRPTDSPVLFLQQLGRGLRKSEGKTDCLVLDFVGQHRKEFRFDRRFRAIVGGTRKDLAQQVKDGFPFLPAGCHMQLDRVAREEVLRSIRESVPDRWTAKVTELVAMVKAGHRPTLGSYLEHTGLELDDVYKGGRGWSDMLEAAGIETAEPGPHEKALRRAVGRLRHVDDQVRLSGYRRLMYTGPQTLFETRVMRMLLSALFDGPLLNGTVAEAAGLLQQHPQVLAELDELLRLLLVDHVQSPLLSHPDVPLRLHARYTRSEILGAFGSGDVARNRPWREGTIFLEDEAVDLHAFTLDKSAGTFSPTTRYRDYAISRDLLHWESQSTTPADGRVGRRYRGLAEPSSQMFFARLRGPEPFWFLGEGTYVRHVGERPMAITWRLKTPIPGDLFAQFASAVA